MKKYDVNIQLKIQFYNNYFIGGGTGSGNVHSYLLRDMNGNSYIPASTIKGCLSQYADMLSSSFSDKCKERLFGQGGNQPGMIYFTDGKLLNADESLKEYMIDLRTGIKISPYTKTKENKKLFTIETGGYGGLLEFESEIQGFLSEDTYQSDVAFIVSAVKCIFALGGGRSVGLGWLRDGITYHVSVDGKEIPKEEIRNWIGGALCISK